MSTDMLDYIYTTAIAIFDEETTAIIIENDLPAALSTVLDKVRIPVSHVVAAVDHIYSGPDLWNIGEPTLAKYSSELIDTMTNNVLAALEDWQVLYVLGASGDIQAVSLIGTVDKSENSKVADARIIYDQWSKDNDYDAALAAGEPVGINSPYHTKGIIIAPYALFKTDKRSSQNATAFRGDLFGAVMEE